MANGVSVLGVYFREHFLSAEICGWLNRPLTTRKNYVECMAPIYTEWFESMCAGTVERIRLVCEPKKDGEKIFRKLFFPPPIVDKMVHRPT